MIALPAALQAAAPDVVLRYLRETTALGAVYEHPAIRNALTQDAAIRVLVPFIATPDYLEGEDALIEAWGAQRPEAFARARAAADALAALYEGAKHGPTRLLLRLAAHRKLDATATGSEVFRRHPALAGLPYFVERIGELRVKIGAVHRASYGIAANAPKISPLAEETSCIEGIERAILPFVPPGKARNIGATWDACCQLWRDMAPLRTFEAESKLLLLPNAAIGGLVFPPGQPPPGYRERITAADVESLGLEWEDIIRIGISPYIADPVADYLAAHPKLLEVAAKEV